MRRQSSFSSLWDDFAGNTREDLLQMMHDLEIPYFPTITTDQLVLVLNWRVHDSEANPAVTELYTRSRHIPHFSFPFFLLTRASYIIAILLIFSFLWSHVFSNDHYCGGSAAERCLPCPDGAECRHGRAFCRRGFELTRVGCRPKSLHRAYKWADRASLYIAARDGDCVDPLPPLLTSEFEELFPKTNLTFLQSEPRYGIVVANGTVRSAHPRPGIVCEILAWLERNGEIVGMASLAGITAAAVVWSRRARAANLKAAAEIAAHAHRILATTDRAIYQYDLKAQLSAKCAGLDRIWGKIVRAIEENPHVCVGVAGSRHEIYWKWIRSDG